MRQLSSGGTSARGYRRQGAARRHVRRLGVLAALVVGALFTTLAAAAPGDVTFVATGASGRLTHDGSRIVYVSSATDVVVGAGVPNIYSRPTSGGATAALLSDDAGQPLSALAYIEAFDISADASVVAFTTDDTLEPPDAASSIPYERTDVYVKNTTAGALSLASVTASGVKGNQSSRGASLDAAGARVAFRSISTNLRTLTTSAPVAPNDCYTGSGLPGLSSCPHLYLKDLGTGSLTMVDLDSAGNQVSHARIVGMGWQEFLQGPFLSADGLYVTFATWARMSAAEPPGDLCRDVFRRSLLTGAIDLITTARCTTPAAPAAFGQLEDVSADGQSIVYRTDGLQVYRQAIGGSPQRMSETQAGQPASAADMPLMSGDGAFVLFRTWDKLDPADTDAQPDLYLKHVTSGALDLLTVTASCEKITLSAVLRGAIGVSAGAPLVALTGFDDETGEHSLYLKEPGPCSASQDADGDGVPDALDVPGAAVAFSDAVPPTLGAGTSATLTLNGLVVSVEDVVPGTASSAVRITASAGTGPGPVELRPCGLAMSLFLTVGDAVTVQCGSVTITVEEGDGITVVAGRATIAIANGVTATLNTGAAGATLVTGVSGGSVTVTVDGVATIVTTGQSGAFLTATDFVGFAQPVDMTGYNVAKAGSALPLKWRLLDAQGAPISNLSSATVSVKPSDRCGAGTAGDEIETYVSGNQTALQNLGNGYYELDWRTTKAWVGSCKQLVLSLNGATVVDASPAFRFK